MSSPAPLVVFVFVPNAGALQHLIRSWLQTALASLKANAEVGERQFLQALMPSSPSAFSIIAHCMLTMLSSTITSGPTLPSSTRAT
jgi:hypothetical protein